MFGFGRKRARKDAKAPQMAQPNEPVSPKGEAGCEPVESVEIQGLDDLIKYARQPVKITPEQVMAVLKTSSVFLLLRQPNNPRDCAIMGNRNTGEKVLLAFSEPALAEGFSNEHPSPFTVVQAVPLRDIVAWIADDIEIHLNPSFTEKFLPIDRYLIGLAKAELN